MPSKSAAQKKFMAAVANNPTFAKKVDVPQSVGKEYAMMDKKKDGLRKMASGGKSGMHRMPDGKMMKDSEHKGMKAGGMAKAKSRDGCAVRGKTRAGTK